ncbi:hypothetical protein QE152_g3935 [Popillia japonica]|uniref:DUF7869 domain-containing protein n=1 Tax=Popillia japonica TaxID=7064 RepID=A0AAW1N2B1_POPJA
MTSRGRKILNMLKTSASDGSSCAQFPGGKDDILNIFVEKDCSSDDSIQDPNYEPEDNSFSRSNEINDLPEIENELQNDELPAITSAKRRKNLKGDTRKSRAERKINRNLGKEYVTMKQKKVAAKQMQTLKLCRNKCFEKYKLEILQILFNDFWALGDYSKRVQYIRNLIQLDFWALGDYSKRVQYIRNLIQLVPKKTTRVRDKVEKRRNRTLSALYFFSIDGNLQRTCRDCFTRTFDISNKFIETIINKKKDAVSGIFDEERRGSYTPKRKRITDEAKELARKHILSIPLYESHYTRKRSSKKYLPSYYTLTKVYDSYKEKHPENYINRKIFEKIFHNLNIKIKKPKKDTCGNCDKLLMKIKMSKSDEEREAAQNEINLHHKKADEGYTAKNNDKSLTKSDPTKQTICFDLQQCLPTPDLQSGESFYKRVLWTFDLTIHDCDDSQAYCYLWHETLAKRGGNEIGSCLYKFLTKNLTKNVSHIIMYSDSCAGQNKNSFISAACFVALQNTPALETIDHKFLLPGHTHMECDSDHSLIERHKKKSQINVEHPHDWAQLIRQVGKAKPFKCDEMLSSDFLDFASLFNTSLTNRKQYLGNKKKNNTF